MTVFARCGRSLLLAMVMTLASAAQAAGPSFGNIDEAGLKDVIRDFSSVFVHSSVSPASSLGTVFGVEFGIIAGNVQTPGVGKIVSATAPGTTFDSMPHFALLGAVSVPFGITGEINYIPEIDTADVKLSNTSFAIKWTMTDTIVDLGNFDVALKAHFTNSTLSFSQTVSSVNSSVEFSDSITGFQLIGSMDLVVVEPYVGIGTISADGEISYTGASVFAPSFTAGTSASSAPTGTQYFAGIQANLLFLRLGLEYGRSFDADRIDAKFSFKF